MADWLRVVLALVVGAHGLGHILFLAPLLGLADWGQPTQSWLLGSGGLAKGVGSLLWAATTVGFVLAAMGIFGESSWWRTAAIASSVVSIVGLALYWSSPVGSPVLSAFVFNLLVLGSLLFLNWPPITQASG